ncbi:sensor histidine kinase [Streptomyces sp. TLI_171]|uniref:sensor histidine kinase n=1 Tax=Streptomyces sp. TLI_171 TaxID=1938859 RepID=UPI000C18ED01|nr:sensor histidine kinase [Streptomyces sp. TLI_171]RKE18780.1 histidine kinase/DNA gyrase B/HSP90-like ATPase [Streptomyces sp. TLI_171]
MDGQHHGGAATAADPGPPRALWTHADALVAVGAGLLDAIGYLLLEEMAEGPAAGVPGFLFLVLSALPLLARRRAPLRALAAVLALQGAADLRGSGTPHFGAVLVVALYSVARVNGPAVTAGAALATSVTTVLCQSHFRTPSWQAGLSTPFSALLVAGAGLAFARWQREVAANRSLLADRAVAEERRRIARELHDIVAHHITTMQLMAGGARANLADPEVVRDALVTLESSGRLALREMRQLLDVLRAGDEPDTAPPAPQPGADDLGLLVADSVRAGLPTDLDVAGSPRPLPPTLGLTVYRIVQEALTNARKHGGPAARASVALTYRQDALTVEVTDDGAGARPRAAAAPSGGHGLIGMRERVAVHGGALSTGPRPGGGFTVLAELPLTATGSEPAQPAAAR